MSSASWPSSVAGSTMFGAACDAMLHSFSEKKLSLVTHAILSSCITEENVIVERQPRDVYFDTERFLDRVHNRMSWSTEEKYLLDLSSKLKAQYYESLQNPSSMLPSFNHHLPTGNESGKYIAVDLGGSTLRVAFIQLSGRDTYPPRSEILNLKTFKITPEVKSFRGHSFFNWMAERIEETLLEKGIPNITLPMGVSWSFPIEQTSHRNGLLMKMGKGFSAADDILKQDLADLIQESCRKRGLMVHLDAITNDSAATLLAKAYSNSATAFSLILGTGVNAAIHLPTHLFPPSKFGDRPAEWYDTAKYILVNTELSMMGKNLLPATEWDMKLKRDHPNPDYQPLEHFVSGRYLGEIVRLILIDGIEMVGLFGGIIPPNLSEPYSLETLTISQIESDQSPNYQTAREIFWVKHPSVVFPTERDIFALRSISSCVINRASGLVAASIFALWQLRNEANGISVEVCKKSFVACTGSVIEHYPGFKSASQRHLDSLVSANGCNKGIIQLVSVKESSLIGAAVASAVASTNYS